MTSSSRITADASITAVWLDSDKGVEIQDSVSRQLVQDRTALVYVGADVYWMVFVPNKKLISVLTSNGTAIVPYAVEPRRRNDEDVPDLQPAVPFTAKF